MTEKPAPDVPDELVALAADAIRRYDWDTGISSNPDIGRHQRGEAAAVLAAVVPVIERQVRERVAAEIEDARGPRPRGSALPDFAGAAYDHAARIARGESR